MSTERVSSPGLPAWPSPPTKRSAAPSRRFRWVARGALPISLLTVAGVVALLSEGLEPRGRLAFFAFAAATVLWSTTSINAAFVGMSAVVFLVVTGAAPQEALLGTLAADVIWLLIGAYVIAAALKSTGVADRLVRMCLGRARTVAGAFWLLTLALVPLSFVVPSTSGRAAMLLPMFHRSASAVADRRVLRAMALLIPVVVLTSTSTSLIAATSHLIVNELLEQQGARTFSFGAWALYGAPFGIVASLLACGVVLRWVVGPRRMAQPFAFPRRQPLPFGGPQIMVSVVTLSMVALWLLQPLHGLGPAIVAVGGALVLTFPGVGPVRWKEGLRAVSWNLVLFMGSALVLARLLLETGVAEWLVQGLLHASPVGGGASKVAALLSVSLVALTAHLYMPSHSARAAVLMPPLFVVVAPLGLDVTAVAFIATMGSNYCLTFPVSSKALQMYQEVEPHGLDPAELLRVGAILLPLHLMLIVLFYFGYWSWTGLAL
jgi:di/tricarboxylate transporter